MQARDLVERAIASDTLAFHDLETRAEEDHDPQAQFQMGYLYSRGLAGLPIDLKRASEYFEAAAASDVSLAHYNLGLLYLYGAPGIIEIDRDRAREHLLRAASDSREPVAQAQYLLGWICDQEGNLQGAFTWYQKCAQRFSEPMAEHNLAMLYYQGRGTPKSIRDAIYWLEQAAKQGTVEAQYALGQIYATEPGVRNPLVAAKWYLVAAASQRPEYTPGQDYLVGMNAKEAEAARTLATKWIESNARPHKPRDYSWCINSREDS